MSDCGSGALDDELWLFHSLGAPWEFERDTVADLVSGISYPYPFSHEHPGRYAYAYADVDCDPHTNP